MGELVEPDRWSEHGQHLVGEGRVGGGEAAGIQGDHPGPGFVDQPGGHPRQGPRKAGGQVGGVVDNVRDLDRARQEFHREFLARELTRSAVNRRAPSLRRLELDRPAAGELRDDQGLLPRLAVLLPPRGQQYPDQLVIGQARDIGHRRLGQRSKHRGWRQRVRLGILRKLGAKPFATEAVRAAHRREQLRVHVDGVPEADRDPLSRPLRRCRIATCLDLPVKPRAPLIEVAVSGRTRVRISRTRIGTGKPVLVHVPNLFRLSNKVLPRPPLRPHRACRRPASLPCASQSCTFLMESR